MGILFKQVPDQFTIKVKVDLPSGDSVQTFSFHCRFKRLTKSAMDDLINRIDETVNLDEAVPLYREFWLGFEPKDLESWAAMEETDPKTGQKVQVPITDTEAGYKALLDELPIRQSILRAWFMANAGDKARRKN
jgi:hypothetical protein